MKSKSPQQPAAQKPAAPLTPAANAATPLMPGTNAPRPSASGPNPSQPTPAKAPATGTKPNWKKP